MVLPTHHLVERFKVIGILKLVKAAGRLSGVIGAHDDGRPVSARRARVVAAVAALVAALLAWRGLPPDVAAAISDLLLAVAG